MSSETPATYQGEERRRAPRSGEPTAEQVAEAFRRLVKEGRFTERDGMRARIFGLLGQTPLDEAGRQKVEAIFNDPQHGYAAYALPMLMEEGRIDPNKLPAGSAPFWTSPEEALAELQGKLTMEQLAIIERIYDKPAIVIEPVLAHRYLLVPTTHDERYDYRMVGDTTFSVSPEIASKLNRQQGKAGIDAASSRRSRGEIVGWRIGIVEKGKPKVLDTDGEAKRKTLENRVRAFIEKYGRQGFKSAIDNLLLYAMMMARSREENSDDPINNILIDDDTYTMGTEVENSEFDDEKELVACGGWEWDWKRNVKRASLFKSNAIDRRVDTRVRPVVMFNKS